MVPTVRCHITSPVKNRCDTDFRQNYLTTCRCIDTFVINLFVLKYIPIPFVLTDVISDNPYAAVEHSDLSPIATVSSRPLSVGVDLNRPLTSRLSSTVPTFHVRSRSVRAAVSRKRRRKRRKMKRKRKRKRKRRRRKRKRKRKKKRKRKRKRRRKLKRKKKRKRRKGKRRRKRRRRRKQKRKRKKKRRKKFGRRRRKLKRRKKTRLRWRPSSTPWHVTLKVPGRSKLSSKNNRKMIPTFLTATGRFPHIRHGVPPSHLLNVMNRLISKVSKYYHSCKR